MHSRIEVRRGGSELCVEGTAPQRAFAVVSGWLLRTRLLRDGRRLVLGFILPGDTINLSWHVGSAIPGDVECLTDVTLADVEPLRRHITNVSHDDPIWLTMRANFALDEAIAFASIARLARQSAYERLALLILELRDRLALVGLADETSFHLPVTQQVLSDALGLSVVHVNRTLMQLKRDGLVERDQRMIHIRDPEALVALVDYCEPDICAPRPATPALSRSQPRLVASNEPDFETMQSPSPRLARRGYELQ